MGIRLSRRDDDALCFRRDGEFQFGLLQGYIVDGWFDDDGTGYEFRWEGNAEMDEAAGTCMLNLQDKDHLEGELTFDNGDSSGFLGRGSQMMMTSI